jgi:hypothetical protein
VVPEPTGPAADKCAVEEAEMKEKKAAPVTEPIPCAAEAEEEDNDDDATKDVDVTKGLVKEEIPVDAAAEQAKQDMAEEEAALESAKRACKTGDAEKAPLDGPDEDVPDMKLAQKPKRQMQKRSADDF